MYSPHPTARLRYVCEVLAAHLRVSIRFLDEPPLQADRPLLSIGHAIPGATYLAPSPLLEAGATGPAPAPHDLLGQLFWLLAEPWAYPAAAPTLDAHGRPVPPEWHQRPVLQLAVASLLASLQQQWPGFRPPGHGFRPLLTFDIDHPWAYRHKPYWRRLGSLGRDLMQGRTRELWARLRPTDPLDPRRYLAHWPAEQLVFFWLASRAHRWDNGLTLAHPALQRLIKHVQQAGVACHPHPGYRSGLEPAELRAQLAQWQQHLGQPLASRQHFLRYSYPDTFRTLLAAGVRADWSAGYAGRAGYRHGTSHPFYWYDCEREETTPLLRVPFAAMDRALHQQGLDPEQALLVVRLQAEEQRSLGGPLCLLLHNAIGSELYEWRGWSAFYTGLQALLR